MSKDINLHLNIEMLLMLLHSCIIAYPGRTPDLVSHMECSLIESWTVRKAEFR